MPLNSLMQLKSKIDELQITEELNGKIFTYNLSFMFESLLKLLDDYLSELTTLESLRSEQLLLSSYKNLLAYFESTISHSALGFFRKQEEKDIISDFYKIVNETDQIFNQSPSNKNLETTRNNPEKPIQPDPSDITLYL